MPTRVLRVFTCALLLALTVQPVAAQWGRHATYKPGWERLRQSAVNALHHPMTLIPVAAGLAFFASGHDEDWARSLNRDAPVFGNPKRADEQSDVYRLAGDQLWILSMLLTDSGKEHVLENKLKGTLVQVGAVNATYFASNSFKGLVDRGEPARAKDDRPGEAFTSNHAMGAFAHASLIRENMRHTRLARPLANGLVAAGYVAAAGSSWGRIEAGDHHVSDQLVGAGVANFIATFINDAFMGESMSVQVGVGPQGGYAMSLLIPF
ncbi:MAG: phosphatase PAP2 family protein [Thiohalomonadaceae bacterium]